MIRHIAMWKLKEENKEENAKILKRQLETLVLIIPEITALEVGLNITSASGSYDVVLNSVFNSVEDLEKYQKNPNHLAVAEFCDSIRLERTVVDYSFQDESGDTGMKPYQTWTDTENK